MASVRQKREIMAWWVSGGLSLVTLLLTAVVELVLPASLVQWSGLGMLLWVLLAGTVAAGVGARAGLDRFRPLALRMTTVLAWVALLMCARAWGLMLFKPNSNMFTILFPVTLPLALMVLWSRGRTSVLVRPRTMLITTAHIAAFHLVYFAGRTSPATKLFMVFLPVSLMAVLQPETASRKRNEAPSPA